MSRHTLFVLLLATGVALAGDDAAAGQAATVAQAQPETDAAQGQTQQTQAQAAEAQPQARETQAGEAQEPAEDEQAEPEDEATLISTPGSKALGMSILGNQEAPTSLVIVPWKSSEPGASLGISTLLDDSRGPVDKDVFMRALRYYEIRSETKP